MANQTMVNLDSFGVKSLNKTPTQRRNTQTQRRGTQLEARAKANAEAAKKPGAIKDSKAAASQKAFANSEGQKAIKKISNNSGMRNGAVTNMYVEGKNSNFSSPKYKDKLNGIAEGDKIWEMKYEKTMKKAAKADAAKKKRR